MRLLYISYVLFRATVVATLAYRGSFIAGVFSNILWISLALVSISVVTYQSPVVGGWTRHELFLVQGIYSIVLGIMYFLFIANFRNITRLIRLGDLDFILVKPYDSQYLVSIGRFSLHSLARIVTGFLLVLYVMQSLHLIPSALTIVLFCLLLTSSMVIVYSIWFSLTTTLIWLVDLFNLDELFVQITGTTRYPLEILRHISRILLYITLPLVVITTVPAQTLLNKLDISLAVWSVAISIIFFIASRKFWFFALRYYTSASS